MTVGYIPPKDNLGIPTQKVKTEIEDNAFTPKYVHAIKDIINNTCTLSFEVPGVIGAASRYIFDGFVFTDVFTFGDKVSAIDVRVSDANLAAALGVSLNDIIDTFHETELTGQEGWLLWAGQSGTGELDAQNGGGLKNLVGGVTIDIIITTVNGSLATKAGANLFWCSRE